MSGRRNLLVQASLLVVLTVAAGASASLVEDGKTLAIQACSACHQVEASQKRPPPVSEGEEGSHVQAPTFAEVAKRCYGAVELRSKIVSPHYPMREQEFMPIDLDGLAAYIRSLAPASACVVH